jgi:hypothetical protein
VDGGEIGEVKSRRSDTGRVRKKGQKVLIKFSGVPKKGIKFKSRFRGENEIFTQVIHTKKTDNWL